MGWAIGYDTTWRRDIGYGVPAVCDQPDCGESIDRGLSYVCGGEPYGGDMGCGLYFCYDHLSYYEPDDLDGDDTIVQQCARCGHDQDPFPATPDVREWVAWKLSDESWAIWRAENPGEVSALLDTLAGLT